MLRLTALFEADPLAKLAYAGKLTSLKDPSDSGQDLSLLTRAAHLGWKEGELRWLIRQARHDRGASDKHAGYYDLTVTKALQSRMTTNAQDRIHELLLLPESTRIEDVSNPEKLALLSGALGLEPPITRVTRTIAEPMTYRMHWNGLSVELGKAKDVLDQTTFRANMVSLAKQVVPRMKGERWDALVQVLIDVTEDVEVGAEGNIAGLVEAWIENYTSALPEGATPQWKESAANNRPFRDEDGKLWLSTRGGQGLALHIKMIEHSNITHTQLAITLRSLGWNFERRTIRGDEAMGVFTRGLWKSP